jgi:hypothetical protein
MQSLLPLFLFVLGVRIHGATSNSEGAATVVNDKLDVSNADHEICESSTSTSASVLGAARNMTNTCNITSKAPPEAETDTETRSTSQNLSLDDDDSSSCTLYFAPSSIPNAGYGIFTIKSFHANDMIQENDGPNILIVDPDRNSNGLWDLRLWHNVWWGKNGGMNPSMMHEAKNPFDFQLVFGALPNYHPFLKNLDFEHPRIDYDDSSSTSTSNPGAGASSYYTGKNFFADREIEAGEELFLDYGEHWLDDRSDFQHVPRYADYIHAGEILSHFRSTLAAANDTKKTVTTSMEELGMFVVNIVSRRDYSFVLCSFFSLFFSFSFVHNIYCCTIFFNQN